MSLAGLWPQGGAREGEGEVGRDVKLGPRPAPPCWVSHRGPRVKGQSIQCIEDWTQVRPRLDGEGGCDVSRARGRWPRRLDWAGRRESAGGWFCARTGLGGSDPRPRISKWGDLNSRGCGGGWEVATEPSALTRIPGSWPTTKTQEAGKRLGCQSPTEGAHRGGQQGTVSHLSSSGC